MFLSVIFSDQANPNEYPLLFKSRFVEGVGYCDGPLAVCVLLCVLGPFAPPCLSPLRWRETGISPPYVCFSLSLSLLSGGSWLVELHNHCVRSSLALSLLSGGSWLVELHNHCVRSSLSLSPLRWFLVGGAAQSGQLAANIILLPSLPMALSLSRHHLLFV